MFSINLVDKLIVTKCIYTTTIFTLNRVNLDVLYEGIPLVLLHFKEYSIELVIPDAKKERIEKNELVISWVN